MIFLVKEIKHEKCSRKTFSKIGDSIDIPNLIKVQKDSYDWFIQEGLGEVLRAVSYTHLDVYKRQILTIFYVIIYINRLTL